MSRARSLSLWLVFLTATASVPAGEPAVNDLAGLQGVWSGAAGAKKKIVVTMEIRGRTVAVLLKPPIGATIRASGVLRIDATARPKSLDWVSFAANDGQALPEILGIYELAGDTFRICTGGPDNPRPSAFEPGEGMLADVVTLTRQAGEPVRRFHAIDPVPRRGLDPRADRGRADRASAIGH